MPLIEGCCVVWADGRTKHDVGVLFKDNGWVRVGDERPFHYYPPHAIDRVSTPPHREEGGDA